MFPKICKAALAGALATALLMTIAPTQVAACSNYVGTVCLDDKAKKKKQQTTTKKKKRVRTKKAAEPAQPAKPVRAAAASCMVDEVDKKGNLWDSRVGYRFTVRNRCDATVLVFLEIDTCVKPAGYMGWTTRESHQRSFALKPGQSKSVNYMASPRHTNIDASAHRAYYYSDQAKRGDRSKYRSGC